MPIVAVAHDPGDRAQRPLVRERHNVALRMGRAFHAIQADADEFTKEFLGHEVTVHVDSYECAGSWPGHRPSLVAAFFSASS